ncbi:MAG: amidoligase family protein [Pseudomonadota bacterium]|nr:amidoligase family protein [Pseudomonadota bacterium]
MIKIDKIKSKKGHVRKLGLEYEYSDLPLDETCKLIQNLFGGEISCINNSVYEVEGTKLGTFKVELDALPVQKLSEQNKKIQTKSKQSLVEEFQVKAGAGVEEFSTFFTPFEIVTPPIEMTDLEQMKKLEDALREHNAAGTKSSFKYAFGLHLNPEVYDDSAQSIVAHLQSFLMLEPWLIKNHNIDFSRKLTSFIDPFPKKYIKHVLREDYQPNMDQLIDDYHAQNPTRNRSLDLTPLLCFINEERVRNLYGEKEKINKRPTFHYRLPNCEIGQKNWSFKHELELWLKVENLAHNQKCLKQLMDLYQEHESSLFSLESKWVEKVEEFIKKHEI